MTGVLLYRIWVMVLSAFSGSLLMAYAVFSVLERLDKLSSAAFAARHAPLLNWGLVGLTALGILMQFLIERRRKRRSGKGGQAKGDKPKEESPPAGPPPLPAAPRPWWKLSIPVPQITWRKAG